MIGATSRIGVSSFSSLSSFSFSSSTSNEDNKKNQDIKKSVDKKEDKKSSIEEKLKQIGANRLMGECSVTDCLAAFTDAELLQGDNSYRCLECTKRAYQAEQKEKNKLEKKIETKEHETEETGGFELEEEKKFPLSSLLRTRALKRTLIESPPKVLTLHLKRFRQTGNGRLEKISKHIKFSALLNLTPFLASTGKPQKEVWYGLYGIVVHSGSMGGGHYVAYVNTKHLHSMTRTQYTYNHDGWYYFSDGSFHSVDLNSVLREQAYILFYHQLQT